jgi:apolipoprotein N-acyltransferase
MRRIADTLQAYPGAAYILTGLLQRDAETGAFSNALVMIDQTGAIRNVYKKHHLVPFGEYIPFQRYIPLKPIAAFTGFEQGPGPDIQTIPDGTPGGLRYSPLVCYEVIFPAALIPRGQLPPDFIVNVTNDGWYGNSAGPYQHFTQAVFRAVEEGIPVLRSANTGISAVIDPLGAVRYRSILLTETTGSLHLPGSLIVGRTP